MNLGSRNGPLSPSLPGRSLTEAGEGERVGEGAVLTLGFRGAGRVKMSGNSLPAKSNALRAETARSPSLPLRHPHGDAVGRLGPVEFHDVVLETETRHIRRAEER